MDIKVFDLENYPNLFSLGSHNVTTDVKELYYISHNHNDLQAIIDYCQTNAVFVGYNNKKYDDILLKHILINRERLLSTPNLEVISELKEMSNEIITGSKKWNEMDLRVREAMNAKMFHSVDLLTLFGTIHRTSLKQISINLKYWNVQTLPYPHDKWLTDDEIQEVLDYNFNDVDITRILLEKKRKDLTLRKDIKKRYGVDVMNENDTGIAKMILNKYYSEYTGLAYSQFKDKKSFWTPFKLGELILREYNFKTQPFKDLEQWFVNQTFTEHDIKLEKSEDDEDENNIKIKSKGLELSVGLGGIHSVDLPGKFYTRNGITIRDIDVDSLYPKLMVNYGIKPRHCDPAFLTILGTLLTERLADKKEGRKTEADTKKIVINSIYGLLGSRYYWLRDNKALLSVTINGQLSLCRLIEDYQMAGIKVISANTDGVTCELRDDQLELHKKISDAWMEEMNFTTEIADYAVLVRKDVNNYVCKTTPTSPKPNDIKQKGKYFSTNIELHKGYWYPVIPKALNKYFLEGIKPEDYIPTETSIYEFMASQKANEHKFTYMYCTLDNSGPWATIKKEPMQKSNRWIVTKGGTEAGKLVKEETDVARDERLQKAREKGTKLKSSKNNIIHVDKDNYVKVTNRVDNPLTENYDLKHQFYIDECWEVIRQIEPQYTQGRFEK